MLEKELAELDMHRIEFEMPFGNERVNAWLLGGDEPVLIDCGIDTATSLIFLRDRLRKLGYAFSDLKALVLTHHDFDHVGMAGTLTALCPGIEVISLAGMIEFAADYRARQYAEVRYIDELMAAHGVPWQVRGIVRAHNELEAGYGAGVQVNRAVEDGDLVEFAGRSWRVRHRPGHTPWDTCYLDEATGLMIAGDHLIEDWPSNTYFSKVAWDSDPANGHGPWTWARFLGDSLKATAASEIDWVLPGHGPPFGAGAEVAAQHAQTLERGVDRTLAQARDSGKTVYELCVERWNEAVVDGLPMRIARIIGELEILVSRDAIGFEIVDGVYRYH